MAVAEQVMKNKHPSIVTINSGSSSIKFAIYQIEAQQLLLLNGSIDNIGTKNIKFGFKTNGDPEKKNIPIGAKNYDDAIGALIEWLQRLPVFASIIAIGHRIVHGMRHTRPEVITEALLKELKSYIAFDPEHLPAEIGLVEAFQNQFPSVPQVACFDTSFHSSMPTVAKLLPIPRKYYNKGILRYGFHGLSYAYLLQELQRIDPPKASGKIIMSHLGNGASITAVKEGKSIDTSMGFTPASGLPMSTRTGDLDPGVASYLMQTENLTSHAFNQLVNHQSGLLGISESSGDMQVLLEAAATDKLAADAVDVFCYGAKKYVGAYAAVLGGLDVLVFAGGIGEHSPEVRSRICDGLEFLGIELCEISNRRNAAIISTEKSKVTVRVIPTDEGLMMARLVQTVIINTDKNPLYGNADSQ